MPLARFFQRYQPSSCSVPGVLSARATAGELVTGVIAAAHAKVASTRAAVPFSLIEDLPFSETNTLVGAKDGMLRHCISVHAPGLSATLPAAGQREHLLYLERLGPLRDAVCRARRRVR